MKILITGGSGFIGSNLVRLLVEEKGESVINLDKLTYAAMTFSLLDGLCLWHSIALLLKSFQKHELLVIAELVCQHPAPFEYILKREQIHLICICYRLTFI